MFVEPCISEAAGRGPGRVHMLKQIQVFHTHVGTVVMFASLMAKAVLLNVAELRNCLHSMGVLMRDHVQS